MHTRLELTNRAGFTDVLAGLPFRGSVCELPRALTDAERVRLHRLTAIGDYRIAIRETTIGIEPEPQRASRRRGRKRRRKLPTGRGEGT